MIEEYQLNNQKSNAARISHLRSHTKGYIYNKNMLQHPAVIYIMYHESSECF